MECKANDTPDEEVSTMIDMYQHLGFLLDGVFALARTPSGSLTNDQSNLINRKISCVMKLWRYLRLSMNGPKIHGLEDHLSKQMTAYNGIGGFLEDFVEQSHQIGVKEESRTKGLPRKRAFLSHSNWEWMSQKVGVVLAKKELKQKVQRKRKRGVEERKNESKVSRDTKRLASVEAVENGVYQMIEDYRTAIDESDINTSIQ